MGAAYRKCFLTIKAGIPALFMPRVASTAYAERLKSTEFPEPLVCYLITLTGYCLSDSPCKRLQIPSKGAAQ